MIRSIVTGLCLCLALAAPPAMAQTTASLIQGLKAGGYVLVLRHTHAPAEPPPPEQLDPQNHAAERQMDERGRKDAQRIGETMRALNIPVGEVISSPAFRARQTAQAAGWGPVQTAEALGDGGHSMAATSIDKAGWLKRAANTPPKAGANTVLVTHLPNMTAAAGERAAGAADGTMLVLRPGASEATFVGMISVADWTAAGAGR